MPRFAFMPCSRKRGVDRKTTLREQERRREPLRTGGQSHLMESIMFNRLAPKLLAEFIGTFAFVFIGAGAATVVGDGVGLPGIAAIAFAHGLTIMVFAFAYGPVP